MMEANTKKRNKFRKERKKANENPLVSRYKGFDIS